MYTPVDPKVDFPKQEEAVLHFWEENDVFKKSVAQREGAGEYVFFDGPPFGTGLPVENLIEKELGLNSKTGIEKYGIAKFNEACRASVLRYVKEWWRTINRLGRWVDFDAVLEFKFPSRYRYRHQGKDKFSVNFK